MFYLPGPNEQGSEIVLPADKKERATFQRIHCKPKIISIIYGMSQLSIFLIQQMKLKK